eukprot:6212531-Pleurochrysis_carterae.AAC.1
MAGRVCVRYERAVHACGACERACVRVCVRVCARTCVRACVHGCACASVNARVRAWMRVCERGCACACVDARVRACLRVRCRARAVRRGARAVRVRCACECVRSCLRQPVHADVHDEVAVLLGRERHVAREAAQHVLAREAEDSLQLLLQKPATRRARTTERAETLTH